MENKIQVEEVLKKISEADFASCRETVEFIKNLDMALYTTEEIKLISNKLSDQINYLIQREMK
ncbi:hypothetical protein [Adhaeribacter aquaticus]|uniref:hypothetical protein n=1 Tax=Adhaeribacter aquaticus TaxID=299567 RepID=UPI00041B4B94|nr:hypothetical protein [Adhaeribacter aquaticus]